MNEELNLSDMNWCKRTIESLRQQLAAAQEDTRRLDFMEAFGGECICMIGSQFYYRAGFGRPHAKASFLRQAIDGAIKLVEQKK